MTDRIRTFFRKVRLEFHYLRGMSKKERMKEIWRLGKKHFLVTMLIGLGVLLIIPLLTYLYFIFDLGSKEGIMNRKSEGVLLLDRNDKPFFSFYQAKNKKTIPLSTIPKSTQQAIVAIEDKDFYEHHGFSMRGIARSLLTDIKEERFAAGGSTITQQLVKNALLSPSKNLLRKYQEIILAIEIDRRFSKDDILEMYLNTVYFGEGAFGIEDASMTYFGKHAEDLTLGESALLAGILPAPSALSPLSGDRQQAFKRQDIVLKQMVQQGYITETQRQSAEQEQIAFNPQKADINVIAPHFALMVRDELIKQYGEQRVAQSGFKVKTTIDLDWQKYAEQAVANQVYNLRYNNTNNGAAVAMDPKTGEILALVGSKDWNDADNGKINMAVRPRQPGSSFKPIIYARALADNLITPATVLDDKPVTFPGGYKPKNYDGRYRGHVLARYALANSLNIPAVHVMEKVGVGNGIDEAAQLGIATLTEPSRYGLSLVLGAAEVPLIQMTDAYAVFANRGVRVSPTTILEIKDKHDKTIFTYTPQPQQVLSPDVAFLISSILSDNKARAETFGNSLTISRPAAVKTGTTEDYRDALTIGYTPSLVVGVWVGNNDNTPMDSVAGSLGAAPIWRNLMQQFLAGSPVEQFNPPFGISKEMVCLDNGLKAEYATSSAYMEYFLGGTAPTQSCNLPSPTQIPTPTESPTPTPSGEPTPTDDLQEPTLTPKKPTPTPQQLPTSIPTPTQGVINVPEI